MSTATYIRPSVGTWHIPSRKQVLWYPPVFVDSAKASGPGKDAFESPSTFHLRPSVGTWYIPYRRGKDALKNPSSFHLRPSVGTWYLAPGRASRGHNKGSADIDVKEGKFGIDGCIKPPNSSVVAAEIPDETSPTVTEIVASVSFRPALDSSVSASEDPEWTVPAHKISPKVHNDELHKWVEPGSIPLDELRPQPVVTVDVDSCSRVAVAMNPSGDLPTSPAATASPRAFVTPVGTDSYGGPADPVVEQSVVAPETVKDQSVLPPASLGRMPKCGNITSGNKGGPTSPSFRPPSTPVDPVGAFGPSSLTPPGTTPMRGNKAKNNVDVPGNSASPAVQQPAISPDTTPRRATSVHGNRASDNGTIPASPGGDADSSTDGRVPLLSAPDGQSGRRFPYKPQMKPVDRRRVGCIRRKVRDEWNIYELRMFSTISSHDVNIAQGIGEDGLESLLYDVAEETPEQLDVFRTMRLATRGKPKCANMEQLHYALRSQQARQALPPSVLRMLAEADFGPRDDPDPARIQALMEGLNEGHPVLRAEADTVLHDASLMAPDGRPPSRAELVPSTVAWYLHVERRKTPRLTLLRFWLSRWTPKKDYHAALLDHLSSADLTQSPKSRRRSGAHVPDDVDHATMRERLARCARKGATTVGLVAALALPTLLFLIFVFMGATQGDARCPKDLDGLFTWFGIIGLASAAVDCSGDRMEFSSPVGLALKCVLLVMPWIGVFWTFHIDQDDLPSCGYFMPWASGIAWVCLVLTEMFVSCVFFWELSVLSENEQTLQRTLGVQEEP